MHETSKSQKTPSWEGNDNRTKAVEKHWYSNREVSSGKRGRRRGLKQQKRTDPAAQRCWPWQVASGKLKEHSRSKLEQGLSREGRGTGRDEGWETIRWRDGETGSGRALLTDRDKTSMRYLQPSRKEWGFSTWRWPQKMMACMCPSGFLHLSLRILSGKRGRS